MALTQPSFKTKTYTELVEEARKLIPGLAPGWTNHNPSDPGIALIELLAWLSEMALYRVERVPRANYEKFLCLLQGDPAWGLDLNPEDDATRQADALEAAIRTTVLELRKPYRAITPEDYTRLVMEDWPQTPLINILLLLLTDSKEMDTATVIEARRERIRNIVTDRCAISPDLPIGQLDLEAVEKLDAKLKDFQVKRYLRHNFDLKSVRQVLEGLSVWSEKRNEKGLEKIERVVFVPERDLESRLTDQAMPGHVSVIVLSKRMSPRRLSKSFELTPDKMATTDIELPDYQGGELRCTAEWQPGEIPLTFTLGGGSQSVEEMKDTIPHMWTMQTSNPGAQPLIRISHSDDQPASAAIEGAITLTYLPSVPTAGLCAALWAYLDERRLLTTRHHVVKPDFLSVTISATLHLQKDALWDQVKPEAERRLGSFFDPLIGGVQRKGWPLGRAVYPSEVYQVLEHTPGVDYVTDVKIAPAAAPGAHQLVAIMPKLTQTAG